MKLHYWIPALLCAALFATPALAEEQIEEELPWYEVEIIIFTRDLSAASVNEAWPSDPGLPDFANAQPLQPEFVANIQPAETIDEVDTAGLADVALPIPDSSAIDGSEVPEPILDISKMDASEVPVPVGQRLPVPYTLIPEDNYRLTTEFKRLQRNSVMQPVIHLAWRQPVTALKDAKLLYLRAPEPPVEVEIIRSFENFAVTEPIDLEGTIRVSVNRYLHVEFDLLNRVKQSIPYSSYEQSFGDDLMQQPQGYSLYRMQDKRRMRSGELHYIDHPLMGVLIKITPYELPKPVPLTPVGPEVTDSSGTEQTPQIEGAAATESSEAVIVQPEVESSLPTPGITSSVVELPGRSAE